jgi:hypothetical protein
MRIHVLGIAAALLALAAGCERTGEPTALAEPAGASLARSERADEVAGNPVFRSTLVGNPRPFIGSANPVRGLNSGGLPWTLERGEARLSADGELRVDVEGLVFDPADSTVAARGLGNTNPVAQFRAVLSCVTTGTGGVAGTVNLSTGLFPATTGLGGGDARIREKLVGIPRPCIAPIVFVTSPGGAWFAITGF